MTLPNQNQVLSAVRWIITTGGAFAVGRGWITADQVPLFLGAALTIVPLIWSFAAHTDKATVAAAQAVPAAQVLVSDPALASAGVAVASPGGPATVPVHVPKPA